MSDNETRGEQSEGGLAPVINLFEGRTDISYIDTSHQTVKRNHSVWTAHAKLQLHDGVELHRGVWKVLLNQTTDRIFGIDTSADDLVAVYQVFAQEPLAADEESIGVAVDLSRVMGGAVVAIASIRLYRTDNLHNDDYQQTSRIVDLSQINR